MYERDRDPASRWEGYRIHVDAAGARSLHACLPAPALARPSSPPSAPGGPIGFRHASGSPELVEVEEVHRLPAGVTEPSEGHYAVDRRALRRLLLAGPRGRRGVRARSSRVCESTGPDGRVVARFADGRRVEADLLVGADGVGSRVRRQLLPAAEPVSAGRHRDRGKVALTAETRGWVPAVLQQACTSSSTPGPGSLFTAALPPSRGGRPRGARRGHRTCGAPIDEPYLLTAFVTAPHHIPPDLDTDDPERPRRARRRADRRVAPDLRRVLASCDPGAAAPARSSSRRGSRGRAPSRVTLLGDAVHAVPATGGLGGNTALRDAAG